MKKMILLLVFPLLVISCQQKDAPEPYVDKGCFPVSETAQPGTALIFELQAGQEKVLPEHSLSVKVLEINDSRCPSNAICVHMGSANVKVEINQHQTVVLCLGACGSSGNSAVVNVNAATYALELTDVNPYPEAGQPLPVQKAVFRITKK
ncbi:MAG: hypothetical protein LPJ89_03475 [Hymenobacteraceae bacterium]|nr:hypothetical protein [Hymenobacteraceae bacterium]MDX5396221.1 hypothetical protein [Hymenobacteraceae bacterium]MDX5442824.1 hypothetical protein [Hymenobacteraceae bacterium]MDX5512284.1 hypothetical protein [Hymenobacteraceae bacterium]